MNIALAVTAAGRSLRFGSDKLAYPFQSSTIGETSFAIYDDIDFCHKVIVLNRASGILDHLKAKHDLQIIINPEPERGLSSSVNLALLSILQRCDPDGILFAAADMPFVRRESVIELIRLFHSSPDCICSLSYERQRGKPVIFPKHLFPLFKDLTGDTGGRSIIENNLSSLKTVSVEKRELLDIDTIQDLNIYLS